MHNVSVLGSDSPKKGNHFLGLPRMHLMMDQQRLLLCPQVRILLM
ncbi:hypothetical protein IFM89_020608 [Coptis chinensis]|uniref:Uncharacterized protein n=1 Tax=Coptis chinensis TaxID=261450 RepID=A0A835M5M5_9MAGN|nr:hypothetical protein IFM89_020608 [Coptis chinensis]